MTESTGVSSSISRTENPHQDEFKRVSSRGVIPRAKIKSVKMTLVIVFGESLDASVLSLSSLTQT